MPPWERIRNIFEGGQSIKSKDKATITVTGNRKSMSGRDADFLGMKEKPAEGPPKSKRDAIDGPPLLQANITVSTSTVAADSGPKYTRMKNRTLSRSQRQFYLITQLSRCFSLMEHLGLKKPHDDAYDDALQKDLKLICILEKSASIIGSILWRDRIDVPSRCTIVKTIEWVGPTYGQRKDVVGGSGQKQSQHPIKRP
jgi:hypothetical protein